MKNIFRQAAKVLLSMMVLPFLLVSCYDDSAIWESMHQLENSLNELKAQLDSQAEAMTALLSDGSTIKSCVKQSDGSYLLTLSNDVKFKVLAPGINASALMSYTVIDGEKYWAIYSPTGEQVALTDQNGKNIPVSTTFNVEVKDGRYYIVINGQEYETGYDVEDMVQVFNSCTPLTDASGNVYAMTFDFGEGKQVTVAVDGYKGVVFKLENVGAASKIVTDYYVPYGATQAFLIDVEGVIDYVMQIPYGWKVVERTDRQSGNVYLDVTAPSMELVASGAAFDGGDLKVVAVVEGGDAVVTKLVLSAEPFKKVEFSSTRLAAEPYEGVHKFVYGVIPGKDYDEDEVIATAQSLVSTSVDAPKGYAVSETEISLPLNEILGEELGTDDYVLFVVPAIYKEGDDAGYYVDKAMYKSHQVVAVVVTMSDPVVSLFDAEISVSVKGTSKIWAGTSVKSETLFTDIIYGVVNGITEPFTGVTEYQGPASGFPVSDANDGLEMEPGVTYVTWCLPYDEVKETYTEEDIVFKEFTTSPLVSGGSLEITAGQSVITTASVDIPISSEGASAICYAFLSDDEGSRLGQTEGNDERKFALIQKSAGFTFVKGNQAEAHLGMAEPESTVWLYAAAVDANGKYGKVTCIPSTLEKVQFNSISLTLESIEVGADKAKFKVTAAGGTPVSYIYWIGTQQDPYWVKCGKTKNIAQMYMAVYPEDDALKSVMRAHGDFSENGEITITGLRLEEEYVMVVAALDSEGKYSKVGYKKIKTLAADLGVVVEEGTDLWNSTKKLISFDWIKESFQGAASQGLMARYAFNVSCPQDYTAYILCASDTYFADAGITKMSQIMIEIEKYCSRRYDDGYTPFENGNYACEPDYYKDGVLHEGQMMNVVNFYIHGLPTMGFATYFAPDSHGDGNCIYWENGQDVNYQRALGLIEEYKTIVKYEARAAAFGLKGKEASDWAQALLEAYRPYYEKAEPLIYFNDGKSLYMMNPYAMGIDDKGDVHDTVIVMLKDRQGNYFEPMYFPVPNYFEEEE